VSTDEARDATRGGAVKLFAELLGRALQLVTTLLLARGLGAADFGLFGVLSSVAVVAAEAADLGLQGTAARALVAGTLSQRGIVRAKLWLSGGFLLATLAVLPFFPPLAPLLLYFAGAGWAEILGVALRARGRRKEEAAVIFTLRLSGLALVATSLLRGGALLACAWALAVSTIAPCLLAMALLRRLRVERPSSPVPPDPGVGAILRTSAPLAINGGLALVSLRVELLVMSALRSPEEVGYFLAALQVVQVLNVVPNALCAGAMPALTREALRALTGPLADSAVRRRTAATVALAAAPAAVGLALVAPALTRLLYKDAYAPTAAPLAVLAWSVVPLFLNALFTYSLIAAERAAILPRLTVVRVILAAALAALLVPAWGGPGAAMGFVLSELVLLALGTRAAMSARFPVGVVRPALVALAASVPMAAVVIPLRAHLPLAVVAGVLVYALTVAVGLKVSPRLRRELGYS
jgi:O-antigen/teichoic acid export membrane protein